MPRSTEPRIVANVTTTNSSKNLTAPAGTFRSSDAGRSVIGTGIATSATLATITSDTSAVLSANATASGTVSLTIGPGNAGSLGFVGWSPESDTEAGCYTIAGGCGANDPARITDPYTGVASKRRSK